MMSWIWAGMVCLSLLCAAVTGQGGKLAGAVTEGAQSGISLGISLTGSLCLWSGVGKLMERLGLTAALSRVLKPVLGRIFPGTRKDPRLGEAISANVCANLLGLGNGATPMGIRATRLLKDGDRASDELCRLVVLNTASIQLIPANVAAIRSALGCGSPFDILPAVWLSSFCAAAVGLGAAWVLGKVWKH